MDDLREGKYHTTMPTEAKAEMEARGYAPNKGRVEDSDFIQFKKVCCKILFYRTVLRTSLPFMGRCPLHFVTSVSACEGGGGQGM